MIQIIDAPPRSGKTYFVVNYLAKYWTHDGLYDEYTVNSNVLIISNIDGLRCKHWKLDKCLKEKTHQEFFSLENFRQIMEKNKKNHIILAIDEAHKIFPAGYKDTKVYEFFAEHGHEGIDILFMTQGLSEFTRIFNPLLEFIVSATIRSKSVGRVFSYTYRTKTGQYLYTKVVSKKDLIFNAYKSRNVEEQNKPKNAYIQWIIIIVVFAFAGTFLFKSALAGINSKSAVSKNKAVSANKPLPVQPASPPLPGPSIPVVPPSFTNISSIIGSPSPVNDTYVKRWRNFIVDGYILDGDDKYFMINGRSVPEKLCRNFNKFNMSVQYFTEEMARPVSGNQTQALPSRSVVIANAITK